MEPLRVNPSRDNDTQRKFAASFAPGTLEKVPFCRSVHPVPPLLSSREQGEKPRPDRLDEVRSLPSPFFFRVFRLGRLFRYCLFAFHLSSVVCDVAKRTYQKARRGQGSLVPCLDSVLGPKKTLFFFFNLVELMACATRPNQPL